jgi:DNA-binding LacI/PurR family transcriptional regulator
MDGDRAASGAPTLESVAALAGVSRATVSRVINGVRNVDPEIQKLVQQAIERTGYVPNRAARSLVTGRTGAIALVVSETEHHAFEEPFLSHVFSDPFFGRVLTGLVGELRPRGVHPLIMLVDSDAARAQLLGGMRQGQVDGIVLVSLDAHDPLPRMLAEARLPAVLLGRPARPAPISYVDIIHQAGAALAAECLVARGCQRIATISGPMNTVAGQDRLAGFRDAMARHGQAYVPWIEGSFTRDGGEKAMGQLLADHPETDGVFVANDLMAQGAILTLHDHGRRVPDDIAVVGFDDSSAALACRPPLTTVRQPLEEMAARLGQMLLARIAQTEPAAPTSVIFEPELIVRRSA